MSDSWDERIAAFWRSADDEQPDAVRADLAVLVAERPAGDPAALYERASMHDFLGEERAAVPLYRAALDAGLDGARRARALIQLASSLRNLGDANEAIRLLRTVPADAESAADVGDAAQAFLALALHDAGRHAEALSTALTALAPTLPLYRRAILAYADELGDEVPVALLDDVEQ